MGQTVVPRQHAYRLIRHVPRATSADHERFKDAKEEPDRPPEVEDARGSSGSTLATNHMHIRPFSITDLLAVEEISREALGEIFASSLFSRLQSAWPEGFLVAEIDGHVVGYIAAGLPAPGWACIWMMAVDRPHRNQRVGTALMKSFLDECARFKIRAVELEVRPANLGAIEFYRRHAFKIMASLPTFYGNGQDAYQMVRGSRWRLYARGLRSTARRIARLILPRELRRFLIATLETRRHNGPKAR